jgi:hypothetical protein
LNPGPDHPGFFLFVWQRDAEQVVHGDDRAMARVKAPERRVDQLAIGQRARMIGRGG